MHNYAISPNKKYQNTTKRKTKILNYIKKKDKN